MEVLDCTNKYCIVGAGASGLAAAKNVKAYNIPFEVIEAEDDVGGNWYYGKPRSSVYRSTHLNWKNDRPNLYLNIFHPEYDNLFVAGLIQPDSGQWELVDYQSQLIAKFILAQENHPAKANQFHRLKAGPQPDLSNGIKYLDSTRHYVEIEHFSYRERLKKLIGKLS
jgi:hypothetical protein